MGAQGTASLTFGAFPGKSDASVDVATPGVVSTSLVEAWIRPAATADHTADEHMLETLKVFGTYLSDGNIRIYGFNTSQQNEPVTPPRSASASALPPAAMPVGYSVNPAANAVNAAGGGKGTRVYGTWTIAWVWN